MQQFRQRGPARRAQRGASLFIVTMLVLTIGLMTLTAFTLSRGEFRLVGNLQHQEQAFNFGEATMGAAEAWLADPVNSKSTAFTTYSSTTPGLYPVGTLTADPKTMSWGATNSMAAADGRYLIEQIAANRSMGGGSLQVGQRRTGACRSVHLFRVVAQSSSRAGSQRMIETIQATDAC